jgi:hypothetical protein
MSGFSVNQQEIIKRLEFISEHFIESNNRSLILGKPLTLPAGTSRSYLDTNGDQTSDCIKIFLEQAKFKEIFLTGKINDGTQLSNGTVYYLNDTWGISYNANTTKDVNFTPLLSVPTTSNNIEIVELATIVSSSKVNFGANYVAASATTPEVPATTAVLDFLNTIRVVYNLLDYNTYKRFKANDNTIEVNMYSMYSMGTGLKYSKISGIDKLTNIAQKIIPNIQQLNVSKTNLMAIRRVLHLYDMLIHGYIGMHITTDTNNYLTNIINKKLTDSNNDLYNADSGIPNLQKKLDMRSNEYIKNMTTIDTIDKQLKSLKEDVSVERDNLVSHTRLLKKNSIVYFVFLIIFVACLIVLFGVISNSRNDENGTFRPIMQIVLISIFAISVVSIIIMQVVGKNYLTEPFTNDTVLQTNFTDQSNKYLENTIYITLLVSTYNRYGDISYAMNKEEYLYSGINHQLNLRKNELVDKYTVDYHVSKVLQYRIYLLLQILIILSVCINIGIYTGFTTVLLVFTLFLILFVLYMYIVNSNNLVHTDATKLYWGQPNMKAYD